MKRVAKVVLIIAILAMLVMSFMACSFEYGTPDKLEMGSSSVGERILVGLQVAAMGIGVVFLVLALLIGFIVLFKYGFKGMDALKAKMKEQPKVVDAQPAQPQIQGLENEDDEIAAAITAAIMAYYDNTNVRPEYKSNLTFKVRKIKEIK